MMRNDQQSEAPGITIGRRDMPAFLAALAAMVLSSPPAAQAAGMAAELNEEIISLPAIIRSQTYQLETTLYRPDRTGRHPLIVINHGTSERSSANAERKRFLSAARAFVRAGFAVAAPMRRGYGRSDGSQIRDQSDDVAAYGRENALDIKGAIAFLKTQPYAEASRIVVIGQSTGGLATMAYLSMADQGVLGGVNFHGGVRPHNLASDPLLDARIAAFAAYAKTTTLPSLWFYTANDHSSRPEYIARLYDAYERAGGKAQLVQPGPFGEDGHTLFERRAGLKIWWPQTSAFLSSLHA